MAAIITVAGCSPQAPETDLSAMRAAIRAAVENPARPPQDLERDPSSKPAEVLAFFGIGPGMRVLDFNAATGYYSELLAYVVGERGAVIAHNHRGARAVLDPAALEQRYRDDRLPNVEQLFARHDELDLEESSLDAVVLIMVYHDTYWFEPGIDWGPVNQADLLRELYAALKPRGVIGVVDHHATAGSDPFESAMTLHRIDPAVVRRDFLAAGFELEAESDILSNPADTLTLSVFDPNIRRRTDRFIMRFRRP